MKYAYINKFSASYSTDSPHPLLIVQDEGSWSCQGRHEALWLMTSIEQSSTQTSTNTKHTKHLFMHMYTSQTFKYVIDYHVKLHMYISLIYIYAYIHISIIKGDASTQSIHCTSTNSSMLSNDGLLPQVYFPLVGVIFQCLIPVWLLREVNQTTYHFHALCVHVVA